MFDLEVSSQHCAQAAIMDNRQKMPSAVIVGQWLTALTITSETDSLATCHRRLAERSAKALKLQVLDPLFRPYKITVSLLSRDTADIGRTWLLGQIRDFFAH